MHVLKKWIAYCYVLHLMHDSKFHLMEQNRRKGCTLFKHYLMAENSNLFINKHCQHHEMKTDAVAVLLCSIIAFIDVNI